MNKKLILMFLVAVSAGCANMLSPTELSELLRKESEENKYKIFITPGVVKDQHASFSAKGLRKTKIDGWWVWHRKSEDITQITNLASYNKKIIANRYSTTRYTAGGTIEFIAAELSAVAKAYSEICSITYSLSQKDLLWAVQKFWVTDTKESCLDFGFLLAGHEIQLREQDGTLVGVRARDAEN